MNDILHVLSLDTIGGVEALFSAYLEHSHSNELEHHVLVMHGPCHPYYASTIRKHASSISQALYWHGIKIPRQPRFLRARHLHRLLDVIHPNVILLYNSFGSSNFWNIIKHDRAAKIYYERGAAWLMPSRKVTSESFAHVNYIICNSQAARRMLELRWSLPLNKAKVIANPLRQDITQKEEPSVVIDRGRPLRLGMACRLIAVKGLPLAIHALKILFAMGIKSELHIAGEGTDKESLRSLAERLGLRDYVRFHGPVLDMEGFYRRIDIFLCPSIREPLGNVCIEAGSMKRPVVCTAVDGLPEVVIDGQTGVSIPPSLPLEMYDELGGNAAKLPEFVYDPASDSLVKPLLLDPELLAANIRSLYEDPERYTQMCQAAHDHIADTFRFTDYVSKIQQVILDAAARKNQSASTK